MVPTKSSHQTYDWNGIMIIVSLVKRWSFVLSRRGCFFLEPDADMEDSKLHLMCTSQHNLIFYC